MRHISVKVSPKSKINKVKQLSGTSFKVWVTAAPEKNKANQQVIELLAKFLKIKKSQINLVAGQTIRSKIFSVKNQDLPS